jgi:hypothetical protein
VFLLSVGLTCLGSPTYPDRNREKIIAIFDRAFDAPDRCIKEAMVSRKNRMRPIAAVGGYGE